MLLFTHAAACIGIASHFFSEYKFFLHVVLNLQIFFKDFIYF